jgi:3-oxoacyl-[acyl-carrier protein] reductase
MTLDGRRALVTGGSRGIGRATALALARAGAAVAFNYARSEDEAEAADTLAAIRAVTPKAQSIRADVADAAAVKQLVADVRDALGGAPDILVNNAAVSLDGLVMMLSDQSWSRVLDVNLTGAFLCCKAVLRGMIAAKWGRIVNVVSPAAFFGKEGAGSYAAAKGGLVALSKSLAREVARFNITVNAVSPGYVDTHLIADMSPETRTALEGEVPLGRFARPEEVADVIAFLASSSAGYMTGTTVHVDGGLTML